MKNETFLTDLSMFSNACAIPDGNSVVVTGGTFSEFSVTRYSSDGVINDPDLPWLSSGRWSHACAKYLNEQQETVGISNFRVSMKETSFFRFTLLPGARVQMAQGITQQRSSSKVPRAGLTSQPPFQWVLSTISLG